MSEVKWGKTFLLALVLLGLGSLVYWNEFERKPKQEKKELAAKRLFSVASSTIAKIEIVGKNGPFNLECALPQGCKANDSSTWSISNPEKIKGDSSNIDSLLSSLAGIDYQDRFDLSKEDPEKRKRLLTEYGLSSDRLKDPNTKRIRMTASNGESMTAYFGETHPINDAFFVSLGDENTVYVVPNYIKLTFERDLTYWRDKHLFSIASPDIDHFELHGVLGKSVGDKKEGVWTVNGLPGDFETIDSLLNAALLTQAKAFVTEKELSQAAKFLTLELRKTNEKAITLNLYIKAEKKKDAGKLYARVSNLTPLFELEMSMKDRLDHAPKDFRQSKLMTMMERFASKRIEFSSKSIGSEPLVIENRDGRWIDSNHQTDADYQKVQGLLDKLSGNQIRDFDSKETDPPKSGVTTVRIYDELKVLKKEFLFWDTAQHDFYAADKMAKRKESFKMDLSVREYLPTSSDFFVPRPSATPKPQK